MNEFKKRFIFSVIILSLIFTVSYRYSGEIITYIISNVIKGAFPVMTVAPLEILYSRFYISTILSLIIFLPIVFINVYCYVTPALYENEIKIFRILMFPCLLAFVVGFTGFGLFGAQGLVYFISNMEMAGVTNSISLLKLIHFIVCCCTVSGVMCCYPIFIYLINYIGLIKRDTLKRYRKHMVVIAFILGALVTPPDVITQCILAVPLIVLHELSIFLIRG